MLIPISATALITTASSIRRKVSNFIRIIAFFLLNIFLPSQGKDKRHKKEVAGLVSGVRVICLKNDWNEPTIEKIGSLCASPHTALERERADIKHHAGP
jgi:hypothetical protein